MKGATIGHAKQRIVGGRYIGLTEPGIIAAEPPNPIVNQLVIMPDIEKRLEAFVRLAHGVVVFPGGVGTAEEILYLLGILLEPANAGQPLKVVLTGPRSTADYFIHIRRFIEGTLGKKAAELLHVIVDDPAEVARFMVATMEQARDFRRSNNDSYNYNWLLKIPRPFQHPFEVTHESMRGLRLYRDQPAHELAADLRRAFSGIVTGNVKENGVRAIEKLGPYELTGDASVMKLLDELLTGVRCAKANETSRKRLPALLPAGPDAITITSYNVKSARAFRALRAVHNEKICANQHASPASCRGRVNQFLSFWCDENVGLRQPKGSNAHECLRQKPGKFSERHTATGGHRRLCSLARAHAAHARASCRDHQESLHLV